MTDNDFRFFTNTDKDSLLARFQRTLMGARFFDVLVGYFRSSGFNNLYKSLGDVEKIRILVGLSADEQITSVVEELKNKQGEFHFSKQDVKENYTTAVKREFENSEDNAETEESVSTFIRYIQEGRLEIRAFPEKNIHAKVYITRYPEGDKDFGRVITGSSNFSENGLKANREFNVELKDKPDVDFALKRFEELWKQGTDITKDYIETINTQTWLNPNITPYEIYLKLLYEYFKEDINFDKENNFLLPDGFMELEYQKQAVVSAKKILNTYNGVFLADVVGLGKTYITALLLQQLSTERKLILCPPVLQDTWKNAMRDFRISGFTIESIGKIDKIEAESDNYDIIVVDEAHRFRNEVTWSYETLHNICRNKKVILVSATPINNRFDDLLSLIKLFQPAKQSTIPGVPNLENFFKIQKKKLATKEKGSKEYLHEVANASTDIRNKILSHLMIRRTRSEIKKYFQNDIKNQGLYFPQLADPHRIVYVFDEEIDNVFNETINLIKDFSYSRYTPLLFLKEKPDSLIEQQQKNVGGFMKGILVKRLESSFFAFKKTTDRFVESYEKFIRMYNSGVVYISKAANVYDLLENDQEDKLLKLVEEEKAEKYDSDEFNDQFIVRLNHDLTILKQIQKLWKSINIDPKLDEFVKMLKKDKNLNNKKVVVFTESKETSDFIYNRLNKELNGRVLRYSSEGADYHNERLSSEAARLIIKENFDPKSTKQLNDIDVLITTDVLAEGINLHRSNILINYDLPWNPTKVLQRVGRVNRVGTEYENIHVYNCFPTVESNNHIHLEENIISKIQAFHNTLGEDAKYLSDEEEVGSHELFGTNLYKKLNDKKQLEAEDEDVETELKYLNIIRSVRDHQPELFEKIKKLPKKARTAQNSDKHKNVLISFFRKGVLKKFVYSGNNSPQEIDFMTAAAAFECEIHASKKPIPKTFFDLLKKNKEFLQNLSESEDKEMMSRIGTGRSNETQILNLVKFLLKDTSIYTEEDEEFLNTLRMALELGTIPKKTAQATNKELKKLPLNDRIKVLGKLKMCFPEKVLRFADLPAKANNDIREIILSEYFYGDNK